MWEYYNPNPLERKTGDCAVRALSKALDTDWESAYAKLCSNGFAMGDMPNSNQVISAVLRMEGFYKANMPNECPDCYSVEEFCEDNPKGVYVLGTGTHVVAIEDGKYYDTWDSGDLTPIYVFYRDEKPNFKED